MSNNLSNENIELAEEFIKTNKCNTLSPCLSISDVANAIIEYSNIINLPPTSYIYIGSNSYGMTSYGFYKTRNNNIYIIEAFINNINTYYDPKNCYFLNKNEHEKMEIL